MRRIQLLLLLLAVVAAVTAAATTLPRPPIIAAESIHGQPLTYDFGDDITASSTSETMTTTTPEPPLNWNDIGAVVQMMGAAVNDDGDYTSARTAADAFTTTGAPSRELATTPNWPLPGGDNGDDDDAADVAVAGDGTAAPPLLPFCEYGGPHYGCREHWCCPTEWPCFFSCLARHGHWRWLSCMERCQCDELTDWYEAHPKEVPLASFRVANEWEY